MILLSYSFFHRILLTELTEAFQSLPELYYCSDNTKHCCFNAVFDITYNLLKELISQLACLAKYSTPLHNLFTHRRTYTSNYIRVLIPDLAGFTVGLWLINLTFEYSQIYKQILY